MPVPLRIPTDPEVIRKFRIWFKVYGVLLILLGIVSILLPGVATIATTLTVGWLLIIGGVIGLVSVFQSGTKCPGFWWNLLSAILYLAAGGIILWNPIRGVLTLTIVISAYLLATGLTKVVGAFHYKSVIPRAWGWMLFSAVVDIALGAMIFAGLPGTAVWVIGLLVGVNLLFSGVALLAAAFYCRSQEKAAGSPEPAKA